MSNSVETAILADIGATSSRFAILAGPEATLMTTYAVADHATPVEAARAFLSGPAAGFKPQIAVFAAAGPVVNGRVTMVNAAWVVDAEQIKQGLGLRAAHVINDFEAQGWALPGLQPKDLAEIGQVPPPGQGTMAVLGPGTARPRRAGIEWQHRVGAGDRGRPRHPGERQPSRGCHHPVIAQPVGACLGGASAVRLGDGSPAMAPSPRSMARPCHSEPPPRSSSTR